MSWPTGSAVPQPAREPEPEPATIKRNGGKPPDWYKPPRPNPLEPLSPERRAMALACEYLRGWADSQAWTEASDDDRTAALTLIEQGRRTE